MAKAAVAATDEQGVEDPVEKMGKIYKKFPQTFRSTYSNNNSYFPPPLTPHSLTVANPAASPSLHSSRTSSRPGSASEKRHSNLDRSGGSFRRWQTLLRRR